MDGAGDDVTHLGSHFDNKVFKEKAVLKVRKRVGVASRCVEETEDGYRYSCMASATHPI